MSEPWILTFTGRQFWPLTPKVEDVCIEDIAHALSCICRFNGMVKEFYSVAQHSVLASELVHRMYAREALLHDATEAYLCDVPRPLKEHASMMSYRDAEQRLAEVIAEKFHLQTEQLGGVKAADEQLLLTERRDLMAPGHWIIDETQCLPAKIHPWYPRLAESRFLRRFEELFA